MEKKKKNASFSLPGKKNQGNGTETEGAESGTGSAKKNVQRFDTSKIGTVPETDSVNAGIPLPQRDVLKTRRWSAGSFVQTPQHVHSPTTQEDKILLWVWMVTLFPAILWISNRLLGAGTLAHSNNAWLQVLGFVTFFVWCSLWFKTPKAKWKNAVMSPLGRLYVAVCLICSVVLVCLALTDARSDAGYILYFIFASWLLVVGASEIPQHTLKEDSDDDYARKKEMQTAKSKQTSYRNATWLWGELIMTVAVIVFLALKITRYEHVAKPAMFAVWFIGLCTAMICYRYGFYMDQLHHRSDFRKSLRLGVHLARVVLVAVFLLVAPDVMYSAAKSHFDETTYRQSLAAEIQARDSKITALYTDIEDYKDSLNQRRSEKQGLANDLREYKATVTSLRMSLKQSSDTNKKISKQYASLGRKFSTLEASYADKVSSLEESIDQLGKQRAENRLLKARLRSSLAEYEAEKRSSDILRKRLSTLQEKYKAELSSVNKQLPNHADLLLLKRARRLTSVDWQWLDTKTKTQKALVDSNKAHQMAAAHVARLQQQNKQLLAEVAQRKSIRYTLCTSCGQACEQGVTRCPRTYVVNGKPENCNGAVRRYQDYKLFVAESKKHNATFVRQLADSLRKLHRKERSVWLKQSKEKDAMYAALLKQSRTDKKILEAVKFKLAKENSTLRAERAQHNRAGRKSIIRLRSQVTELTTANSKLSQENGSLAQQLKKLRSISVEHAAFKKEVTRLKAVLVTKEKIVRTVNGLNATIAKKESRLVELAQELQALNKKCGIQSTLIGKQKARISILQGEKKKLAEDLSNERTDTVNLIQRRIRNKTFELNNSVLKLKGQVRNLTTQTSALTKAHAEVVQKLKVERANVQTARANVSLLTKNNVALNKKLGDAKKRNATLSALNVRQNADLKKLQSSVTQLESMLASNAKALKRAEKQLRSAYAKIREKQLRITALEKEVAAEKAKGAASAQTLTSLHVKVAEKVASLDSLQKQFNAFKGKHADCSGRYVQLKNKYDALRSQSDGYARRVVSLKRRAEKSEAESTRLKPFEQKVAALTKKVSLLDAQIVKLQGQLRKLKKLEEDFARVTQINTKLRECKQKYLKLIEREKQLQGQLTVFKEQYRNVRKELDELQSRVRVCGHCFEISRDPIGCKCTEPGCRGLISRLVSRKEQKELRKQYLTAKKKD